jgi:hypothetical protein
MVAHGSRSGPSRHGDGGRWLRNGGGRGAGRSGAVAAQLRRAVGNLGLKFRADQGRRRRRGGAAVGRAVALPVRCAGAAGRVRRPARRHRDAVERRAVRALRVRRAAHKLIAGRAGQCDDPAHDARLPACPRSAGARHGPSVDWFAARLTGGFLRVRCVAWHSGRYGRQRAGVSRGHHRLRRRVSPIPGASSPTGAARPWSCPRRRSAVPQ